MEVQLIKLNKIKVNDKNPRTITEDKLRRLVESILVFPKMLTIRPIVVDDKGVALGGNMRTRALKEIKKIGRDGIPERLQQIRQYANKTQEEKNELLAFWDAWFKLDTVPVIYADTLTEEEKREFIIKDNSSFGAWDWDVLANEWDAEQLEDWGVDVWTADENENDAREVEVQEDDFDVCDEQPSIVKRGEVWKLGEHRLMCGDSTKAEDVARLMNGERADLVFTDPPYGMFLDVDYDGMFANDDTRAFDTGKRFNKVKGDNDDFKPELITTIFDNFGDCPEVFIWGADYFSELIPNRKDGSWAVWDKRCSEEMDKVAGNTFELCWSKAKHKRLIARIEWSGFHGMNGADCGKRIHPTQKPIALIDFFIKNWGDKANIVVDLFGGSGTTMIACEQLNRKCRMMELDEHYCDVIIARWEQFTGKQAVKIE